MTPAQQSALEALVGRTLTAGEVAALEGPLTDRSTVAITAALPPRKILGEVSREWFASWAAANGMRATIEDYAATPGHAFRSSALALIDVLRSPTSGINFAVPGNLAMLDAWVDAGAVSREEADKLLGLATRMIPVSEFSVRSVCWSDDGSWLL